MRRSISSDSDSSIIDNGSDEEKVDVSCTPSGAIGPAEARVYSLQQYCMYKNNSKYVQAKRDEERNEQQWQERKQQQKQMKKLTEYHEVHLVHYVLTQYLLHKGLQKFGEKGEEAVMDEFKQLHNMNSFRPI
eukprot:515186-Ditylum_brightwellii.AAC.1